MAIRKYSERLGTLSEEQFQAVLDRFDLGRFIHAEPISFGLFGQNVFVSSTKGEYVLRGAPHFWWQFPTEQFYARQLHEHTRVPVPWPYLVDTASDIFGWSYALIPRMPGVQLADPEIYRQLAVEDRRGIARALGENLALMQELSWPFAGRYDAASDSVQPFELAHELAWPFPMQGEVSTRTPITCSERVITCLRNNLARARSYNGYTTADDIAWVEGAITRSRDALEVPFQPCIVMEDYKRDNVVAVRGAGGWRISGVFDLMSAYFGDGEADLSRTVGMYILQSPQNGVKKEGQGPPLSTASQRETGYQQNPEKSTNFPEGRDEPELAHEFVRAYLDVRPPRPGFAERFVVYTLLDRAILWEYIQRNDAPWWDKQGTFRDWAERYTSFEVL
jgi:hygromycin-B 7''-O-kinase